MSIQWWYSTTGGIFSFVNKKNYFQNMIPLHIASTQSFHCSRLLNWSMNNGVDCLVAIYAAESCFEHISVYLSTKIPPMENSTGRRIPPPQIIGACFLSINCIIIIFAYTNHRIQFPAFQRVQSALCTCRFFQLWTSFLF